MVSNKNTREKRLVLIGLLFLLVFSEINGGSCGNRTANTTTGGKTTTEEKTSKEEVQSDDEEETWDDIVGGKDIFITNGNLGNINDKNNEKQQAFTIDVKYQANGGKYPEQINSLIDTLNKTGKLKFDINYKKNYETRFKFVMPKTTIGFAFEKIKEDFDPEAVDVNSLESNEGIHKGKDGKIYFCYKGTDFKKNGIGLDKFIEWVKNLAESEKDIEIMIFTKKTTDKEGIYLPKGKASFTGLFNKKSAVTVLYTNGDGKVKSDVLSESILADANELAFKS